MSHAVNEKGLQAAIIRAIGQEWPSSWFFKVVGSPYQMTGVPDILVCVHGLLFGLEVKHPKPGESRMKARERATVQQRKQIRLINEAGGVATVVVSVKEALTVVRSGLERKMKEQA